MTSRSITESRAVTPASGYPRIRTPVLSLVCFALLSLPPVAARAQTPAKSGALEISDLLDIRSTSIGDLSDDGRWLYVTMTRPRTSMGIDYNRSFGDPTYVAPGKRESFVIDTRSGERVPLFAEARVLGNAAWSPDGRTLAVLSQSADDRFEVLLWDRASRKFTPAKMPAGRYATAASAVRWSNDGAQLYVSLKSDAWRAKAAEEFSRLTTGPRIVQSSTEPFLAWNGLGRLGAQESVVALERATMRVTDVLPEALTQQWMITRDGSRLVYSEDITRKTDYDVIGGSEQRLLMRSAMGGIPGGAPTVVFPTLRNIRLVWSRDGSRYAFLRDDQLFLGSLGDSTRRRIAGDTLPRSDTTAAARERRARNRFTPVSWLADGSALVATNSVGMWTVDAASGARTMIVRSSDSATSTPRVQLIGASGDGKQVYMGMQSRTTWTRGILRFDRATGRLDTLVSDSKHYGAFRMSEDGTTIIVSGGDGNRPYDLWVMQAPFTSLRRLTDANPQLATKELGATSLLTYLDADGKSQFGVVHYPRGYEKGKTYPTVFIVYEDFFADTWDAVANLLNANGYVVVKPSVSFDVGYPGEAWVKGVTAAANKLIEMGIADSARLGVHGTSYGGYATNLLITQTNRFKAAVNISGKVDMISFYTDSPRLGVRNVHAAEKSQDRIGATLWQQPQKYIAHSAIMFADRITTPLLLMTGEMDGNVPAINSREMYYALRRLGKDVTWVSYAKGGHGTPLSSMDDWMDFHQRLLAFYDSKLKKPTGAAAPRGN